MAGKVKLVEGTPLIEKLMGALGALLLLGICCVLAWDAWRGDRSPPRFRFEVLSIDAQEGTHLVHLRVHNDGGSTVAGLTVEGQAGDETAELTLDYVSAHGYEDGGVLFGEELDGSAMTFVAKSYREP